VRGRCLHAFLHWLRHDERAALLEWPLLPGDGPTYELLTSLSGQQARSFVSEEYSRALFRPRANADAYLQSALDARHRKDLRRKERCLTELGRWEYRSLQLGDDVQAWIDWFLALEAAGWKGRAARP